MSFVHKVPGFTAIVNGKCTDGAADKANCPAPVGGPGPGSNGVPFVDANGNCVVKPGVGST